MLPPILGPPVNRFDRCFARLALVSALCAALGLSACGRKGALDPPPGQSIEGQAQPVNPRLMRGTGQAKPIGSAPAPESPGVDEEGRPIAPTGPNKRIPLDNLLN
jgi:hypothetical protein